MESNPPSQVLPTHYQAPALHAGFWRRVAAWFIDMLIAGALHWLLVLSLGTWLLVPWAMLGGMHGAAAAQFFDTGLQPIGIVILWLYFALCESSRWQATPGKLALGLQVTDDVGQRIGFARASGRYFGKYVSALILGIGFLLAGWTARKQALHDIMAGCCVVRQTGLAAWRSRSSADGAAPDAIGAAAPLPQQTGMPGWAIALLVIAGCFFLIPVAAILLAIAIPAYQSYTVRAEVSQGFQMTERARSLIGEYIGKRGALPGNNADLGLPRPEEIRARYVTSVRVSEGQVVVTFGNEADSAIRGGHVVISPVGDAAMLRWHCSSSDIRGEFLPSGCRN
ncbi:MAG TPA: RDD family protein [Rhodanobacteraceae bacterium]|nr:RDD family protein [Rhodanobacteraceae bacterium]